MLPQFIHVWRMSTSISSTTWRQTPSFYTTLHLHFRWPSYTLRSYCPLFIVVVNKLGPPNLNDF
jgi:hypothetical protein